MEIWKDINGYEGYYQVSNIGNVKRLPYEQNMHWLKKPSIRKYNGGMLSKCKKDGIYNVVSLSKGNKARQFYVHRLVASAFIGNIPSHLCVNHIDGDIYNNNCKNLELVSIRDNTIHASKSKPQSSDYVGVYWNKARKKWVAMVRLPKGEKNYLGGFDCELKAHKAVVEEYKRQKVKLKYS